MTRVIRCVMPAVAAVLFSASAAAEEPPPVHVVPDVVVRTTPEDLFRVGGSAQVLDEEELESTGHENPQAVLTKVPGVYLRDEDGYGLRPNIGLRGASSERSKKVTLLEDGVLFAPAPYSAPAAYYFPLMARMTGVEVWKGPSAIVHGPHTIGGALNLVTRPVPTGRLFSAEIAGGNDVYGRGHLAAGGATSWGGVLVEAVHVHTDGFKDLDGGGPTGFDRTDVMAKGRVHTDPAGETFHQLELKLGYGRELSHETYLGLTDADFRESPHRRYGASALDRMEWDRTQVQLTWSGVFGESWEANVALYRHDLGRAWRKVNGFADGTPIADVLAEPTSGARQVLYEVVSGKTDSGSEAEGLLIGTNDRTFVSEGVQARATFRKDPTEEVAHEAEVGLRLHRDQVVRDHTEDLYLMTGGRPVPAGGDRVRTADSTGAALAFAAWARYAFHWRDLTLSPGVRTEVVGTTYEDRLGGGTVEDDQAVFLGGLGVHFALTPDLGVLAGVHEGSSPVAPGPTKDVSPERSTSYEAGLRWSRPEDGDLGEVIGFFQDYSNLLGQCSFAAGCGSGDLDTQFDAGAVDVWGLEVAGRHAFAAGPFEVPVRLAYTYTGSRFRTSFTSENPQLGEVEEGDELPYVPDHQLSLQVGLGTEKWGLETVTTWTSEMREEAGQGDPGPGGETDPTLFLDLALRWQVLPALRLTARAENVLQDEGVASRRPFGARPGRPFLVQAGLRFEL